jgi:hypothetical protein
MIDPQYFIVGAVIAYIDPGTGSLIIQILIANLVGCLFLLKNFRSRVKELLSKIFRRTNDRK